MFSNANVRGYNRRVQSVPSNIMASMCGFHEKKFFEVEESVRAAPQVDVGSGGEPAR